MNKIIILGSGGAGKSTFARQLGQLINIKVHHLDVTYWKAGWKASSKEELLKAIEGIVSHEQWIIDGNYSSTINVRLKQADSVFYFDLPTLLCLYRVIKRRIQYHKKSRPDMNEGCKETIDWEFIKWITFFKKNKRPGILGKLEEVQNEKNIVVFKNRKQIKKYLLELEEKQEVTV